MAETTLKTVPSAEGAAHANTVDWSVNLAEKIIHIPLGVGRVARTEMFRAAYGGVDWLESLNQAQFKILRELLHHVEKLSVEFFDGLETVVSAGTGRVRGMSEAAGAMVSKTAVALTAKKNAASTPA